MPEHPRIRTVIVDDEPLANDRLKDLLQSDPEIDLVAVCSGGEEAVTALQDLTPDLVFLDIQMPEVDGFEVLRRLPPEHRPVIVFVTAYNQFAVEAFECAALDYLLKPFNDERFETALGRAKDQVRQVAQAGNDLAVEQLLSRIIQPDKTPNRLALRTPERTIFIDFSEVDWISSARNYVEVHTGSKAHLVRETLRVMERRLPENLFFKLNRSTIVNTSKVRELTPLGNGLHVVVLKNGTKLPPTRHHDSLMKRLTAGS